MEKEQRVVVVGVGYFEERFLKSIVPEWPIMVIEMSHERIESLRSDMPEIRFVHGDATSRLTWKGLHEDEVRTIIIALSSEAACYETCRLVREVFSETIPLVVIHDGAWNQAAFQQLGADMIQPVDVALQVLRNRLQRNYSRAINIGLGQGELLEITILSASHLIDRKLKYLRPSRWAVSAVYRNGALIVPTGNTVLKVGDRVVLVGDPKVLENVAAILNRGVPQFPLQYGPEIVVPLHSDHDDILVEAKLWLEHTRAARFQLVPIRRRLSEDLIRQVKEQVTQFRVGRGVELFGELFETSSEAGMLVLPGTGLGIGSRLKKAFHNARVPFLVSRGSHPYEKVLVSMNNHEPAHALETAAEIARLMEIPFEAFYVALPRELRGRESEEALTLRQQIVEDFENILHRNIPYRVLEGNPVKVSQEQLKPEKEALLVTVSRRTESTGMFNRNVPYRIASQSGLSTLVVPGVSEDA